jgi:hypothetical protein
LFNYLLQQQVAMVQLPTLSSFLKKKKYKDFKAGAIVCIVFYNYRRKKSEP